MNFVPCVEWVSRGKAASTPDKLQLSPEELKCLVDETKELCKQNNCLEEADEDEEDSSETDQEKEQETLSDCDAVDNESDDFDTRYNLDSYDNDDDQNPLFTINDLAVHVDNREDDYLTDEESEGDLEEKENFAIKDSDNLLIVGHVEDSSSVLEIHVYNQENDVFYVHHDIVLPSYPLALAWLDFHPSEDKPGNYIAVGDMSPVIKIWDLDVVDVLEPDYILGKLSKKKKKMEEEINCHSDAVLTLSWNKQMRNLLASGSADSTVIVWDLEEALCLNQLSFHSNKVQSLQWHPTESQFLLSGCADGFLKLYDCRSDGESKSWKVNGEIEKVTWNVSDSFQFFCSTDQGYIHSIDMRNEKIGWSFQAHKEAVTGLDMSSLKPDILVSASMDKTLKVWDLKSNFKMIKSLKLKVGSIYTAKVAPDQELTVAVGGNNASNSLKILNIFKDDEKINDGYEGIKIKSEKEELSTNTKQNKRKIYEIKDEYEGIKIKSEKEELSTNTKQNKRKIYESNDGFESIKIKNEMEQLQNSPKPNKRIIYDTEENYEAKIQAPSLDFSNCYLKKEYKRKK